MRRLIDTLDFPTNGNTPLYDVLRVAIVKAWELLQEGKRVSLFVFSDGKNEGGIFQTEAALKQSLAHAGLPSNIIDRISLLPIWVSKSIPPIKLFDTDWQQPGTVPMVATIESSPSSGIVVDNPISGNSRPIQLNYDFKVSDEVWSKIRNYTGELVVFDRNGKRVASHPVTFSNLGDKVRINIDDKLLPVGRDNVFQVQLVCRFPRDSYISCDRPDLVRVTFSKAGEVSVSIVSPAVDKVAKCGEEIKFLAMTNPKDAVCVWDFGDESKPVRKNNALYRYEKAGVYTYSVRAEKDGLTGGGDTGKVSVIEASVALNRPLPAAVMGERTVLSARGKGPIARYVWSVAGMDEEGKDSKDGLSTEFEWVPRNPGKTKISVRAIMKGDVKPETDSAVVDVIAKPCLQIILPRAKTEQEVGTSMPVSFLAENVKSPVVKMYGADNSVITSKQAVPVDAQAKAFEAPLRLERVGNFSLVAESADGKVKSVPVCVIVKDVQLKLFIDQPKPGDYIETSKALPLVAHVAGSKSLLDSCGGVIWEINGKEIPNGKGKINDKGEFSATWIVPDEFGRKECTLRATTLDAAGRKTTTFSEISITPRVEGSIEIVQPANRKSVRFGEPFDLEVKTSGRVGNVVWFGEIEGKTEKIGTGKKCEYRVGHSGQKRTMVRIHAEGVLPGGASVKSEDEVSITAYCPDIRARLKLPETNIVYRREEYQAKLEPAEGEKLKAVVLDMGDGTVYTNQMSVTHVYTDVGTYTIKASGQCAKCEESFSITSPVIVEKNTVIPRFEIKPGAPYCVNDVVHLVDTSVGVKDIVKKIWLADGEVIEESKAKNYLLPPDPCNIKFDLKVTDVDGVEIPADPITVRVRYGWWLVVVALILWLLIVCLLLKLFTGNGPKGWSFYTWEGAAPQPINGSYPEELGEAYMTRGVPSGMKFWNWNWWTKRGWIRLGDMLALDGCEGSVWAPFSEEEFEVRSVGGVPKVFPPKDKFVDVTGEVNLMGEAPEPYFLFRYIGLAYSDAIAGGHDNLRVRVEGEGDTGALGVILAVVAVVLATCGVICVCLKYAI